jgi:hypothetical protein
VINLIPKEEKKKMVRVFYYKLVVLFLAVGGVSVFIAFVAILPSYFLSSVKNSIINSKLEIQKSEPVPSIDQKTLIVIKDLNYKLDLIENAEKNKFTISEKIINAIISKKIPGIEITSIAYEGDLPNSGKTDKKVGIQGNAPSREVLLSFRQALEDGAIFKQVDLPISNFVKGSDIKFYLSLIP